jgi:ethanolamine ammonia-lyase small subunit
MSLPTRVCLEFSLAHAMARDAVTVPINFEPIAQSLVSLGEKTVVLHSQAENQNTYLTRPDLGRLLNEQAYIALQENPISPVDIVVVVADGLSSSAIEHHAVPFLQLLMKKS